MKKKFGRSCVKTPYTPEKLGNTREYNGNELEQRNPKKRPFWGQFRKICQNSEVDLKILKVI